MQKVHPSPLVLHGLAVSGKVRLHYGLSIATRRHLECYQAWICLDPDTICSMSISAVSLRPGFNLFRHLLANIVTPSIQAEASHAFRSVGRVGSI